MLNHKSFLLLQTRPHCPVHGDCHCEWCLLLLPSGWTSETIEKTRVLSDWRVSSPTNFHARTLARGHLSSSLNSSVWYLAGDCWLSRHVTDDVTTVWQHRDTLPEASGAWCWPQMIRGLSWWSGEYQLNHLRVLITVDNRCGAGNLRNLKSSNFPLNCFHNNREKSLSVSFVLPRIAICSIWTFCVWCPWQYTKYKICTTYLYIHSQYTLPKFCEINVYLSVS